MADGFTVEIRGVDRLARTAHAAANDFRDLTEPNRAAATAVASRARPPRRTGRLAASIGVLDVSPTEAAVGSGVVYAPVIEYGWPAHGIEAAGFLADAADAAWGATQDEYGKFVDDVLATVKGT